MNKKMLTIGILAHVDAGKTTLSESMLYLSGTIRKLGRVDHKDAFLDNNELERNRGITIFSKQARFTLGDIDVTLLDTPGHVDFSAEMERVLQVLDYAILVINGSDGVQGHTLTLWSLLKSYNVPTLLFVNKMDQTGINRNELLNGLQESLSSNCIDFDKNIAKEIFYENIAMCNQTVMEHYLDNSIVSDDEICKHILNREIYPCYFGSALKLDGVKELLEGLITYTNQKQYAKEFGARVFKISRDDKGARLSHIKVTGGTLKVKDFITNQKGEDIIWEEKVDQIRLYSGEKYQTQNKVEAGIICTVTGLSKTFPGEGLGTEQGVYTSILEPVLNYQMILPPECDVHNVLQKLHQLEEEEPHLRIQWKESINQIHVQVMGEVQIQILKSLIKERFDIDVTFETGGIIYKETIGQPVEGVGHFEPLRHYAEVHLLLEPAEQGSGLQFNTICSEDMLDRNWQHLVLTHLKEKKHIGVLIGAEVTDVKITLVAGKSHNKHTEGGDFRQATYRAVRQGLKKSNSKILEPIYKFRIEVPMEMVGRVISDIQKMYGDANPPEIQGAMAIVTGTAPVATMQDYQMEINTYTSGRGKLFYNVDGYAPCHNEEQVIETISYDFEKDTENPTGSIFCANGAGFGVSWDKVEDYMHISANTLMLKNKDVPSDNIQKNISVYKEIDYQAEAKELEDIFTRTYGATKQSHKLFKTLKSTPIEVYKPRERKLESKERYLLVDGYNIIFSWEDLNDLAQSNLESSRQKLLDILSNYQGYKQDTIIVVFDAYKVIGNIGEVIKYQNINVVYTKEAETADQYIEKVVHEIGRKYDVTVATSDALEQMIVYGDGATRMSARDLKEAIEATNIEIRETYLENQSKTKNRPFETYFDE